MPDVTQTLPGLEHLIKVLKSHGLSVAPRPVNPDAPRAEGRVLGDPFDPLLAAMYSRFDGGHFGDLVIYPTRTDPPGEGLAQYNADMRKRIGTGEHLQKVLRYAGFDGFAYELVTVPSLAGSDGIQPVLHLNEYEEPLFRPIASSVDRAFDLYASYCDARIRSAGSLVELGEKVILFPRDSVRHIARDRALVRMLEEGRFDEFVAPNPDSRQWVERILKAARSSTAGGNGA